MGVGYHVIWKCNGTQVGVVMCSIIVMHCEFARKCREERKQAGEYLQIVKIVIVAAEFLDFAKFQQLDDVQIAEMPYQIPPSPSEIRTEAV